MTVQSRMLDDSEPRASEQRASVVDLGHEVKNREAHFHSAAEVARGAGPVPP